MTNYGDESRPKLPPLTIVEGGGEASGPTERPRLEKLPGGVESAEEAERLDIARDMLTSLSQTIEEFDLEKRPDSPPTRLIRAMMLIGRITQNTATDGHHLGVQDAVLDTLKGPNNKIMGKNLSRLLITDLKALVKAVPAIRKGIDEEGLSEELDPFLNTYLGDTLTGIQSRKVEELTQDVVVGLKVSADLWPALEQEHPHLVDEIELRVRVEWSLSRGHQSTLVFDSPAADDSIDELSARRARRIKPKGGHRPRGTFPPAI